MRFPRLPVVIACVAVCSCSALIGTKDIYLDTGTSAGSADGGVDVRTTPPVDAGTPEAAGACDMTTTMTSPTNCGRCGHSCLGGACVAGECQPIVLASGISPRNIEVDTNHVYWIEPSTARAMQANKDGSGAIQLGGGTVNYLMGLGIDETNVYWTSRDEILLRCKIGGCANTPDVVTSAATYVTGAAVDATNAYWLENPTGPARVRKIAKTATMGTGTTIATDDVGAPAGYFDHVVTDGQFVYWTADDGAVRRVSVNGGTVDVVGKSTGAAGGLAVDDVNVYWSSGSQPGIINIAPKNGSALGTPLAASQSLPLGVAVDRNSVYWVNAAIGTSAASGTVMTCVIASCTPRPLATGQRTPVAIAVDETAIYWSNFDTGNDMGGIMRLAK